MAAIKISDANTSKSIVRNIFLFFIVLFYHVWVDLEKEVSEEVFESSKNRADTPVRPYNYEAWSIFPQGKYSKANAFFGHTPVRPYD
jgi:hypothetical protein